MSASRVLIAGVGNVFFGDDAFGVVVARRLLERAWPAHVRVEDFGIRGVDFAYALLEGYDAAILVDTLRRGRVPGTLYVVEPEIAGDPDPSRVQLEPHAMDPARVLGFVRAMGGSPPCLRVVGCEPNTFGDGDDPAVGLSEAVEAAVDPAVAIVEGLVRELTGRTAEDQRA